MAAAMTNPAGHLKLTSMSAGARPAPASNEVAIITGAASVSEIYVVYMDDFDALDDVALVLRKAYAKLPAPPSNDGYRVGEVCAAKFASLDGDWYRSVITAVDAGEYTVRSLDYGCVESLVPHSNTRELGDDMSRFRMLATRVELSGAVWIGTEAFDGPECLPYDVPVYVKVVDSAIGGRISVDILVMGNDKDDTVINELLGKKLIDLSGEKIADEESSLLAAQEDIAVLAAVKEKERALLAIAEKIAEEKYAQLEAEAKEQTLLSIAMKMKEEQQALQAAEEKKQALQSSAMKFEEEKKALLAVAMKIAEEQVAAMKIAEEQSIAAANAKIAEDKLMLLAASAEIEKRKALLIEEEALRVASAEIEKRKALLAAKEKEEAVITAMVEERVQVLLAAALKVEKEKERAAVQKQNNSESPEKSLERDTITNGDVTYSDDQIDPDFYTDSSDASKPSTTGSAADYEEPTLEPHSITLNSLTVIPLPLGHASRFTGQITYRGRGETSPDGEHCYVQVLQEKSAHLVLLKKLLETISSCDFQTG